MLFYDICGVVVKDVIWLAIALLLPCVAAADGTITKGYFKEVTLTNPAATRMSGEDKSADIEYTADKSRLVLNYNPPSGKAPDNITLNLPGITSPMMFDFAQKPAEWRFYDKNGGYAAKSGAAPVLQLQVAFPDCQYVNICRPDGDFSVRLASVSDTNSRKASFFVNGEDVTTLFQYDENNQLFRIKEFYQQHFYKYFKGARGRFSWRITDDKVRLNGAADIILADRAIKGRVRNTAGKVPPLLVGKSVTLSFAGSDTVIPHSVSAVIDSRGDYSVPDLASFDYSISIDGVPSVKIKLGALAVADNITTLEVSHVVPDFDMILSSSEDVPYRAGEFIILNPQQWDARLTGKVTDFRQMEGDPAKINVTGDSIALILPTEREDAGELVFHGAVGSKKFLLKIPHPVKLNTGYEQFGMLDSRGIYAQTRISGLQGGGVLPASAMHIPAASVNSITRISKDYVKMHVYTADGKAADVTPFFIWSDSRQSMLADKARYKQLYDTLLNDSATLAATFCDRVQPDACFRIKQTVRPGGASVSVTVQPGDKNIKLSSLEGVFVIFRELHVTDSPVVRVAALDSKGVCRLDNIPAGSYQAQIADISLKHYGSSFINITDGDNMARRVLTVKLTAQSASGGNKSENVLRLMTEGNLVPLSVAPVTLYRNNYELLDLKQYSASNIDSVVAVNVLGEMPGEYILYPDNILSLLTADINKDIYATMLFTSGGRVYQLPFHYIGSEYPVVTEEGMDYTMCPDERPLCGNAFVSVKGAEQGIYNGKKVLQLTFPVPFGQNDLKVFMESDADVTEIFNVSPQNRSLTLKKEAIPGFLSNLATNSQPVRIEVKNKKYYLSLLAGYKSIEASVVDNYGAQSSLFSGLKAKASCEYAPDKFFSKIATIKGMGIVLFDDLPDCTYRLSIIDKERLFRGELDRLALSAGQNRLRTIFQVSCTGSNDQYVENCQPFLPVVQDRRLMAPDFGVLFVDRYISGEPDAISLRPSTSPLRYKHLGRGVIIYAPPMKPFEDNKSALTFTSGSRHMEAILDVGDIGGQLVKTVVRPPRAKTLIITAEGLTPSYVYTGSGPLVFKVGGGLKFSGEEVKVFIELGGEETEITHLFTWDGQKSSLTLDKNEYDNFRGLLAGAQQRLYIALASDNPAKYYKVMAVIGGGAADIIGEAVIDPSAAAVQLKDAKALLIGKRSKNGNDFRQLTDVKSNRSFRFPNVPLGLYDLVVFDMEGDYYGSREISVQAERSDLYLELPVKKMMP